MICYQHGKPSLTRWQRLSFEGDNTRLDLFPQTGRSHQLRLHCIGLGHRIVGDDLYMSEQEKEANTAARMMLHAKQLQLLHPTTEELITFNSAVPF